MTPGAPVIYRLEFGLASLVLTLSRDRFTSKGPMQNVDLPLSALRHFCVAPAASQGDAWDSQLVLTWDEGGKQKSKKLNVRAVDSQFQALLTQLRARRPDASLLHLTPSDAQAQMGVLSTRKLAWMIVLGGIALLLAGGAIAALVQ